MQCTTKRQEDETNSAEVDELDENELLVGCDLDCRRRDSGRGDDLFVCERNQIWTVHNVDESD